MVCSKKESVDIVSKICRKRATEVHPGLSFGLVWTFIVVVAEVGVVMHDRPINSS